MFSSNVDDNFAMSMAGKVAMERLTEEELEAIEKARDPAKTADAVSQIRGGVARMMQMSGRVSQVPVATELFAEGESPAELLKKQTNLAQQQVDSMKRTEIVAWTAIGIAVVSAVFTTLTFFCK